MNKSKNPKVDEFLGRQTKWQKEFKKLRSIALSCQLSEQFKWGHPCYTIENKNVVLIHGFNEYCALLFFKGALLDDPNGILIQQTENVQSGRQIRFTNTHSISELETILPDYIERAIEVEKAGLKLKLKETSDFTIPEEFQRRMDDDFELKTAFESLTPGRQRGYIFHFSEPKQSKTKESRIDKCLQRILDGKGLND